jgi:aspartyl protease family protein
MMKGLLFVLLLFSSLALAELNVQVIGLFKGAALLKVNGQQTLLKEGKTSSDGVLLVSANTRQAVIEVGGQRQTLGLSQHISSQYSETDDKTEVAIPRNLAKQYITYATLNGRRQQVLVDTGANTVAMSSRHAKQLGLDYEKTGTAASVRTASGIAPAYRVTLRSISVGGIHASGVEGMVVEGDFPQMILLGMTYLQHVDMREQDGTLYLQAKY